MKKEHIVIVCLSLIICAGILIPQQSFAMEKLFYYFNNTYGLTNFKKNAREIDVIAPQIYTVGYDFKITKDSNDKILKEARRKRTKVVPLLVNANFNKVLMSDILLNQKAQDYIIEYMLSEAKRYKYAGWQFDFENINHLDREMYNDFVKKTYKIMKENNLEFSVAVIPRSKPFDINAKDQDWSSGYDFKTIALNSDYISIMSYDDPYSLGPVASIPFTQKILTYMLTQVPSNKISLGIPLYCWKWNNATNTKVRSLTHELAQKEYEKGTNTSKGYNRDLGSAWFKYTLEGIQYTTWCEGEESIEAKLNLINTLGLRGFSAWAIGQEDKWFWRSVKGY